MQTTYYKTQRGKESGQGTEFCRTNGIVPLYRLDAVSSKVKDAGHSEMVYDFIIKEDKEYDFPDGDKERGFSVLYRWSTNPFTCIVKSKDVKRSSY